MSSACAVYFVCAHRDCAAHDVLQNRDRTKLWRFPARSLWRSQNSGPERDTSGQRGDRFENLSPIYSGSLLWPGRSPSSDQRTQMVTEHEPHKIEPHFCIAVDKPVSHAGYLAPREFGTGGPCGDRDLALGLTDPLE